MKLEFPFPTVEGYISHADKENLRLLAARVETVPGMMVEVGSYQGLSALCLLSGGTHHLVMFDWFEPDKRAVCVHNLEQAGMLYRTTLLAGDFKQNEKFFPRSLSLAFIDHTHALADTKAAYEMFWPRLVAGGIMAFHDYSHPDFQEPREFLDSLPHKRILQNSILALVKE